MKMIRERKIFGKMFILYFYICCFCSKLLTRIFLLALLSITSSLIAIFSVSAIITNPIFAQSSEENIKLLNCEQYKDDRFLAEPKILLINCLEYLHSDYDTVEEYLNAEHPELISPDAYEKQKEIEKEVEQLNQ